MSLEGAVQKKGVPDVTIRWHNKVKVISCWSLQAVIVPFWFESKNSTFQRTIIGKLTFKIQDIFWDFI